MRQSLQIFVSATLLILPLLSATPQPGPSPRRNAAAEIMLAAQRSLIVDQNTTAARAEFLAAIQQDPTFAAPRFNLGVLAEAREEWAEAANWFRAYLLLDSTSSWSVRARSELARVPRRAAVEANPVSARRAEYDRHIQLGRRLVAAAMFDDALAEASRAHVLSPTSWEAYALASAAAAPTGRYAHAMALLDTAITRAPSDAAAQLQRSRSALARARDTSSKVR